MPCVLKADGPEAVAQRESREAAPALANHRDAAPTGPGLGGETLRGVTIRECGWRGSEAKVARAPG